MCCDVKCFRDVTGLPFYIKMNKYVLLSTKFTPLVTFTEKKVRNSIILKKASLRHCVTKLLSTLTVFDVKICKKGYEKITLLHGSPYPYFKFDAYFFVSKRHTCSTFQH